MLSHVWCGSSTPGRGNMCRVQWLQYSSLRRICVEDINVKLYDGSSFSRRDLQKGKRYLANDDLARFALRDSSRIPLTTLQSTGLKSQAVSAPRPSVTLTRASKVPLAGAQPIIRPGAHRGDGYDEVFPDKSVDCFPLPSSLSALTSWLDRHWRPDPARRALEGWQKSPRLRSFF
ncbi:hypothetical protein BDW71DRAFT_127024 [Aspergillus fruticulosus]